MSTEQITAVAALISALAATVTLGLTLWLHHLDGQEKLLEHRREALLLGLQVIDHVYSNEPLDNGKAPNPHKWDIQLAHNADNQIRIYCLYPETHAAFKRALGLYNPKIEESKGIDIKALDEFRRQIALELNLKQPKQDPNYTWISRLAGSR